MVPASDPAAFSIVFPRLRSVRTLIHITTTTTPLNSDPLNSLMDDCTRFETGSDMVGEDVVRKKNEV